MPFTRPRSAADIMTRSLLPTLEGNFGMSKHQLKIPSKESFDNLSTLALSTCRPESGQHNRAPGADVALQLRQLPLDRTETELW